VRGREILLKGAARLCNSRGRESMSDYKDYEVRVNYEGGIYISARNEEEAIKIFKEIMLEETNPDMAKYLIYKVEETILREKEKV
jgi:hypothetical protein